MAEKQVLNKISEEIIARAAMKAALSVKGVNHLSDSLADNITKKIAGKVPAATGVKVSKEKDSFIVDIFLVADYGAKIPQLAWDIQNAVKENVLKLTDKKLEAVNIHVQGVTLPKERRRIDE